MKTKTTLSISEARKKFFSIADEVQEPEVYYTLTERGRPKAVIVSADCFETLIGRQEDRVARVLSGEMLHEQGWVIRESPKRKYGDTFPKEEVFILREAPKVLYVDRKASSDLYQAKELAKSHLYIELIETYKYPLYLVEVGRCVRVGLSESSGRFIETDIIVSGHLSNIVIVFVVVAPSMYDTHRQEAFRELYDIAGTFAYSESLHVRMVYYTRSYDAQSGVKRRCSVVSYNEYPSFEVWVKSGEPTSPDIPTYQSFLEKKQ